MGHLQLSATLGHLFCPLFDFNADEYGVQMINQTLVLWLRGHIHEQFDKKGLSMCPILVGRSGGQVAQLSKRIR